MMKKVVIAGFIVCLFVVSAFPVHAADHEEKSFPPDPEDDVLDYSGEEPVSTDKRPNIDIIDITYLKESKKVTLTLTVKGVIENRGDINDEESFNFVSYMLSLYTLDHSYTILYINNKYNFTIDDEEVGELTDFRYAGSTLTVIFDLKNKDETYAGLDAATMEMSLSGAYTDDFYDYPEELAVSISAPSTGKVGQSISFSATVSGGTSYEYVWDFNEDSITDSAEKTTTYTYQQEGTYTVSLIVNDTSTGNIGYDESTITITASGTSGGSSDKKSDGSGFLPFIILVVVIVVAGIAVVVYVMRR